MKLGRVISDFKKDSEKFCFEDENLPFDLLAFWSWSSSDLMGNALRGHLAEFIVSKAIGSQQQCREEWGSFDLVSREGVKVEVKSSAYLQSWGQEKLSAIKFGIQPTLAWDADTNIYDSERCRQADVYIFCVLTHTDMSTVNPLNLDQWEFYVATTKLLNQELGEQKSISLSGLLKLGLLPVGFSELDNALLVVVSN